MTELASSAATDVQPRRFTSDEVQAMLQAGILHEDVYRTRHLAGLDATVTPRRPASIGDIPVRDILGGLPDSSRDSASDADAGANVA